MTETTLVFGAGFVLLGLSLYGLMVTRHLLKIIAVLQIMAKAAMIMLAAAGHVSGQMGLAQSLIVAVITVDTMVAVLGLALAVRVHRQSGSMDITHLVELKG